jgi:hypothetical protein
MTSRRAALLAAQLLVLVAGLVAGWRGPSSLAAACAAGVVGGGMILAGRAVPVRRIIWLLGGAAMVAAAGALLLFCVKPILGQPYNLAALDRRWAAVVLLAVLGFVYLIEAGKGAVAARAEQVAAPVPERPMPGVEARRFAIALSYAREYQSIVRAIADGLSSRFGRARVLFDEYHGGEFARPKLDKYLPDLYRHHSELVVVFLCPQYTTKKWCRLEWTSIRELIKTPESARIMLLSIGHPGDLSDIGVSSSDGLLDINPLSPVDAAEEIFNRYNLNRRFSKVV